jgi:hypothetical protein
MRGPGPFRRPGRGPVRDEPRFPEPQAYLQEDSDFKIDLPTFDRKLNPDVFLEWLQTVERIFELRDHLSEDKMMKLVATKIRGYALLWWDNLNLKRS